MFYKILCSLILTVAISCAAIPIDGFSQDPLRFEDEIREYLDESPIAHDSNLIIFTGSSSIRFWETLADDFPKHNVINRGFGGSHMSDLQYYLEDLVIKHSPAMVFIYEGDNDIADSEEPSAILAETALVVQELQTALPDITIGLISVKPSIARWDLRSAYKRYNQLLEDMTATIDGVYFVDVWKPMLVRGRMLREDLFVEDGLHMNAAGYQIWTEAVYPYMPLDTNP